ncbi:hypothetical protein PaeCFBP13512_23160 [Paenibacillus sp. CFBP13512]|uniref:hypothetical protein n=1 Tax=Paenibacillus sp. CFBP13512 TaxID=2184007 RepID=UPI0010C0E510|nr:hypothetical protein [Paenibacillus sp. CFBP13512]TKJ83076.1 hypothetical protein PaeCFBP13512_23160 [Paenibacillus sp. CFBP13512]
MSNSKRAYPNLNSDPDKGTDQKRSLLNSYVPGIDDETYEELQNSVSSLLDTEQSIYQQKTFLLEKKLFDRLKERSAGKKKGFETEIMNKAIKIYLDAMDREEEKRNNS